MFPWAVLILVSLTLWALIGLRLRRFAAAVCFPRLKDVDCPVDLGVIIPARNEERDLPDCLRSLLQQEGVHPHIVVVDDGSADDTAAIAAAILEPAGGLVKSAGPPPPGWTGKNWALRAGLQGFAHDLILFLDADVRLLDTRVLAATAATIRDGDADVVGLLPG